MMITNTFTASIHKEDSLYVASCIEIGTVSQGDSIEEALANLKEATELFLDEFPNAAEIAPTFLTTFTTAAYA